MFVLAHLSDPHLPLPEPRFAELLGKRITGYLNWRLRRGAHHRRDVLDALMRDLEAARPDHIAVTGDLANISLDREFAAGREFLAALGPPGRVTVIPGNHDVYVRGAEVALYASWKEFMTGDEPAADAFPFLRRRGPLALIALSTGVATPIGFATGRLGPAQVQRLDALLQATRASFRTVLIHHPPAGTRPWLRRLEDADAFGAVIARRGAELILSGHDHVAARCAIAGPARPVPVIQVPSASAPPGDPHGGGAYNLYRIDGSSGAWTCEVETRGFEPGGTIVTLARGPLVQETVAPGPLP